MNEARKKIQDFKKAAGTNRAAGEEMEKARFNIKYPENIGSLDYHARNKAMDQALDDAIAQHLGVAITDKDTWPEEFGNILAHEWASGLPDA